MERNTLACPFLQRLAIGHNRLLELPRPALPLPKHPERSAEIHLRQRPIERNTLARPFLQRLAIGQNRLLELPRPALPLPETPKRIAEIVQGHAMFIRPVGPRDLQTGDRYSYVE